LAYDLRGDGTLTGITPLQSSQYRASGLPQNSAAPFMTDVARYAPQVLSILRIMVGLLFFEHGLSKLFGFPQPGPGAALFSMVWFEGAIEFVGGVLLTAGLFTRTAALIMSGEMAAAYFISHAPHSFFPIVNRGDSAVLYCFVFFYIAFAGAGPWSVDRLMRRQA